MTITSAGGQGIEALTGKLSFEQSKNRIVGRDQANLPRLLILANDSTFVMKISAPGKNVLTASDSDLIFNSANNLFKIVKTGQVQLSSPNLIGSSTSINVSHTLGYNPLVFAFISFSPTGTAHPMPYNDIALLGADAGKVRFQIDFEDVGGNMISFFHRDITIASSTTDYIKYYIVQETAQVS